MGHGTANAKHAASWPEAASWLEAAADATTTRGSLPEAAGWPDAAAEPGAATWHEASVWHEAAVWHDAAVGQLDATTEAAPVDAELTDTAVDAGPWPKAFASYPVTFQLSDVHPPFGSAKVAKARLKKPKPAA